MPNEDRAKFKKAIAQIIAAAWEDEDFRDKLVNAADQRSVAALAGAKNIDLPPLPGVAEDTVIKFVANTEKVRYMVIPLKPDFKDADIGLLARVRQYQIYECCCDRSFVEFVKDMVEESVQEEEGNNFDQG